MTTAKFKVGDKVNFKGVKGYVMVVTNVRTMFDSTLSAYSVKNPEGEVAEYDQTQLQLNK